MNDFQSGEYTVIVADGTFPQHDIPLGYLRNASRIVCCDGSAQNLVLAGMIPDAIVGDMDSLNDDFLNRFADRIYVDENQETNDNDQNQDQQLYTWKLYKICECYNGHRYRNFPTFGYDFCNIMFHRPAGFDFFPES